ncbi:MAG: metallophosphoesterase [Desulfotalea sp.]
MKNPLHKVLQPLKRTQNIRGVNLPIGLEFLQLVVTGPPGAGKSYYINQIGGWPNEGYIDLTQNGWWKSQSLTFRPREVHLGIPFKGFKEALTVFDKEWLESSTPLQLDLKRIKIPPDRDGLFITNWIDRYIFEFLIPSSKTIYAQRSGRQEEGYFPVDDDLSEEMVKQQLYAYREVALYLHKAGVHVYIREGLGNPPMVIMEQGSGNVPFWSVEKKIERPSLKSLAGWRHFLFRSKPINWLDISVNETTITKPVRIAHDGRGFQLKLGTQIIFFQPEIPLGIPKKLVDKNWTFSNTVHCSGSNNPIFCRLMVGETAILGKLSENLQDIVHFNKSVAGRHLSVSNVKGDLLLTPLDNTGKTTVTKLNDLDHREKLNPSRYASFIAVRKLIGGNMQELPALDALESLKTVNEILAKEENRPKNDLGNPGAILELNQESNVIVVGDLHGMVDNFLKILTENCTISNLRAKKSILIILGDAIHSETVGELENMSSSVLLMDIIIKLKAAFPEQIHYIRGNHDSFDSSISKGGISQGIVHKEYLLKIRSEEYIQAMKEFWQHCPYIVTSPNFCALHAGPPVREYSKDQLINLYKHPKLIKEITRNRVERPGTLKGYNKSDVKRFRQVLGLAKQCAVIVGHTPLDPFASVWHKAGTIKNHHIIYSGHNQGTALFTNSGTTMVSVGYPYEPLTKLINKLR